MLGDGGGRKGSVYVVGIGPGGLEHLTAKAKEALASSEIIIGYTRYVSLIRPIIGDKETFTNGMTLEVERCRKAIELAVGGKKVSVVSSGDSGIYGMAGLILQLASTVEGGDKIKIEVVPGIPAFVSASAILGAPLMHDFASISLSDLLTPWEKIEERLHAAAKADFVISLYNPKSSQRTEGLLKAVEIIGRYRSSGTPVGLVRNATRDGEEAVVTTLGGIKDYYDKIDMLTILIIGNSTTFIGNGSIITPRGYEGV